MYKLAAMESINTIIKSTAPIFKTPAFKAPKINFKPPKMDFEPAKAKPFDENAKQKVLKIKDFQID